MQYVFTGRLGERWRSSQCLSTLLAIVMWLLFWRMRSSSRGHWASMRFWIVLNPESQCRSLRWTLTQSGSQIFWMSSLLDKCSVSLLFSDWTDCDKHLWASGHLLRWCPCNLPEQWLASSGRENCHRQKGIWLNRPDHWLTMSFDLLPLPFSIQYYHVPSYFSSQLIKTDAQNYKQAKLIFFFYLFSGAHHFLTNYWPAEEVSRLRWYNNRWRFYHQVWREPSWGPWGHSGQLSICGINS